MTNTITEITLTSAQWQEVVDQARELGTEHGTASGTWVEINDAQAAQRLLDGIEAGDPEILDMRPAPLSGEWADGLTETELLRDELDLVVDSLSDTERAEILDAYEAAHGQGFWDEVSRAAKAQLS